MNFFKLISILGLFLICNATKQEIASPVYEIQNVDRNQENHTIIPKKSSRLSAFWRTKKQRKTIFYCLWQHSPILWKIFSYLGKDLPQIIKLAPSKGWIEVFFRHYVAKYYDDYEVPTFLWKNDFDHEAIQLTSHFLNFTTIWVHEGKRIRMTRRAVRPDIQKAQEHISNDLKNFTDLMTHFQSEIDLTKNSATYFLAATFALTLMGFLVSEWALGASLFAFFFAFAFCDEMRKLRTFGISNPIPKLTEKSFFKEKSSVYHPIEYSETNHNKPLDSVISFALCLLLFIFIIQKK